MYAKFIFSNVKLITSMNSLVSTAYVNPKMFSVGRINEQSY